MKKTLIASFILAAVVLGTALGTAPAGVGAQSMYFAGYNARPVWDKLPNVSVLQGQTITTSVQATDDNGDVLTYALVNGPANASFNPVTRIFTFTPAQNQLGSFPVIISASDRVNPATIGSFYVNVTNAFGHYQYAGGGDYDRYYNQAPYFTSTNSYYAASSGSEVNFVVQANDPEGQAVRYSVDGLPSGASFNAETRRFSWTPLRNQRGVYTLVFSATDGGATSVPFNVTIVVDGGVYNANPIALPQVPTTGYVGSVNYGYNTLAPVSSYYGNTTQPYFVTSPATLATAGTIFRYDARAISSQGRQLVYRLVVAPEGAYLNESTGAIAWAVPANAANDQQAQFTVTATDGYSAMATQSFTVAITGGRPTVTTIVNQSPRVSYVPAPQRSVDYTYNVASANRQTVSVVTGRTVVPTNYTYYGANAYGALTVPTTAVEVQVFNTAVRVNADRETIVSWDTSKPARGEVVFGYASQSRGADLNRTILNYDFTTGQLAGASTRHEASLGRLEIGRTYYLRVIARADNQTNISREIVFIPMTTENGQIQVQQRDGAASAIGTLGGFLTSGGFLFFLLLIVIGLIVYLIALNRPRAAHASEEGIPALHLRHEDADDHGDSRNHSNASAHH